MVKKTYPITKRKTNVAVWPTTKKKPVKRKKKEMSLKVKAVLIVGAFVLGFTLSAVCIAFNIGPMNELASLYKGVDNPTYDEMVQFIGRDTTDLNEYTDDYKCGEFSKDVITNAKETGMQAGFVTLMGVNEWDTNHAIIVFRTTDRGTYFVEPQSDIIFSENEMETMMDNQYYSVRDNDGYIELPMSRYFINWFEGVV